MANKAKPRKALYRKYRPTKLCDVVGQDQVTIPLQNAIKDKKIGHAYLFIGPRGTGKTSVARIFAHEVNNFPYNLEDSYLDIIEIDAASNTGVDNIRELREKAIIAPTKGEYKIYIIDEAHMLSKSAANALLKTLEEPPEHVIFIMATTEANKVPITISSRTQTYTFKLATPEIMLEHLHKIAEQEHLSITDDALKIVITHGGGSFRDTLSLLDQITALASEEITADIITDALGLPQDQTLKELLSAYTSGDLSSVSSVLQNLINDGFTPERIASELINLIITHPSAEFLPLLKNLTSVEQPFPEAKLLLALTNTISNSAPTASSPDTGTSTKKPAKPVVSPSPVVPKEQDQAPKTNPTINTTPKPTVSSSDFSWDSFLEAIHNDNNAVFLQLEKTHHEFIDGTLHIYPPQKFIAKVLNKPENSQVLANHLNGIALTIHDTNDYQAPKDERISQISAIMGNVQEIKGDSPF